MTVPPPESHTQEEKPGRWKDPNLCVLWPAVCPGGVSSAGTQGWSRGSAAGAGMPPRGRRGAVGRELCGLCRAELQCHQLWAP